jgi:serine protease SohB
MHQPETLKDQEEQGFVLDHGVDLRNVRLSNSADERMPFQFAVKQQNTSLPMADEEESAVSSLTTQLQLFAASDILLSDAAVSSAVSASNDGQLMTFFLQALISNGVPAVFTVLVIGFSARILRPRKDASNAAASSFSKMNNPAAKLYNDLYGDQQQQQQQQDPSAALRRFLGGGMGGGGNQSGQVPSNVGIPDKQYITMTHLNRKLDSYQFSVTAAVQSQAVAAAAYRQTSLGRALTKTGNTVLTTISEQPHVMQALQKAEEAFLKQGSGLVQQIQKLQTDLTALAVDDELLSMGVKDVFALDPAPIIEGDATSTTKTSSSNIKKDSDSKEVSDNYYMKMQNQLKNCVDVFNKKVLKKEEKTPTSDLLTKLNKAQRELQQAEIEFVQQVVKAVGPNSAASVRTALLGDIVARGSGGLLTQLQDRPLTALFGGTTASGESGTSTRKPTVFVTRFRGDVMASQVANLREEVTAIVRQCKPGDEAVVILQTGGGTVTGYGLAAAQLLRFKDAGLKLTVAVEQVAASGGYMMCCVADRIVASPFAVLGSIGVISDIPNVYERLKKEGVEFQTVTAGKYKRTLTPTKKVTKEDFIKSTADVENIFALFRDFVGQNRPQLDMEKIATGETWFGTDAMERGLCDEIKTADAVLIDFVDADYDVYEVKYEPPLPLESKFSRLLPFGSDGSEAGQERGFLGKGIQWLVRTAAAEVKAEFGGAGLDINQSVEKRYMAKDDSAKRVRSQD